MFCYQCEQTFHGSGCVDQGVCGKDASTAALQDLLLYAAQGVSVLAVQARALGLDTLEADHTVVDCLFTAVTNVSFHPVRLSAQVREAIAVRDRLAAGIAAKGAVATCTGVTEFLPAGDFDGLVQQGMSVGIKGRKALFGDDIAGLMELVVYGLKGTAAYYHHARVLGKEDAAICGAIHSSMAFLTRTDSTVAELLGQALAVGELNYKVMELLDTANTGAYGNPEPSPVRIDPVKGKAILVSGHDLRDLKALLEQTEGTGINIYTHGEMLPAHGYPELRKHKHLVGNYGGAWQNQLVEFAKFPGAILMTTNCIQRPSDAYIGRIFTAGLVAWPGVTHCGDGNFAPVIEAALAAPGFDHDGPGKTILTGFGHNAVLSVADKVVDAVKTGAIKHFFLIGGCDGARPGRNYYVELAKAVPEDCVVMTLACGKYRFNKHDFGTVAGLPRLLDIGQCNDAYSAIKIASALAGVFECGVNDLPLSLVLSWYEQKAVAILLTLLWLGIKNIRIGPALPAFITPNVLNVLVENYNLTPIGTVEQDLQAMLAPA